MKRISRRKLRKQQNGRYTIFDFIIDVLLFIPELIVFPFRILFYLGRGLFRIIGDVFNF
ncbi:hypothetical protein GCM10008967_12900 [Bacillus carboniphilus]|uniref:Uncharacterized protein n=1 Tax=Bacillus carboniphilus TaxID=86663 RepID=A0ABP3FSU9_9BACI